MDVDPDITFFWNGPWPVVRVLFIAFTGYLTLLVLLRISGQRTLAQMSAMDLVITVTIGSAFGRVITAREVALAEVVAAFGGLVLLQWIIAVLWGRAPRWRNAIAVLPSLLYYDGEVLQPALKRHHLDERDLYTAARQQGMGSLEEVRAILLEASGEFTVLSASQYGDGSALETPAIDDRRGRPSDGG